MPRLILIRHAKSDYPWGVEDHDRPLNERGRRDAPAVGAWLDEHIQWDEAGQAPHVIVSTARRAQLTWALARGAMSDRWVAAVVQDEPRVYEAQVSVLRDVVAEAGGQCETLLLVGHNPGLAGLIDAVAVHERLKLEATAKFPTSAVAVLETERSLVDAIADRSAFRLREFAVPRG